MMLERSLVLTRAGFRIFCLTLVLHALAAYAIGPVPIPWLAQLLAIYLFLWIGFKSGLRIAPGMIIFSFFFIYAMIVTSYQSIVGDYYNYMPAKATTPYLPYILLRFMTMASFGSLVFATFWLLARGYKAKIIKFLAILCLLVSLAALYIYLAEIYGLPEPPRTRVGTDGGAQSVTFTYAFHRALGTFREPSHLAEWLVLPLFMTFAEDTWLFYAARGLGVTTLFLTGSLTGIGAILGGIAASLTLMLPFMNVAVVKSVVRMVVIGAIGLAAFSMIVSAKSIEDGDLIEVLAKRIEPLKENGISKSNRNYVYSYVDSREIPWFGDGLGNSNLQFTEATGLDATASFLNLFVNIEMSLGYVGLALFVVFLTTPFVILFANRSYRFEPDHYLILAAYFGWIVVFFAHSEELTFHFAIIYALLIHAFIQKRPDNPQQIRAQ